MCISSIICSTVLSSMDKVALRSNSDAWIAFITSFHLSFFAESLYF